MTVVFYKYKMTGAGAQPGGVVVKAEVWTLVTDVHQLWHQLRELLGLNRR